ncbi:thiamine phosphate synthase [Vibrio sp. LaRot3]|uniref:thiamine phosphate synthase n=1 Tax=Vibrio sp. LaRot3 TaxID=2998829 RepID=UPI0022CE025B|nr:thiamine phosphate synthase [Vibrio sp. LaRot3]MDA0150097.1 thiamine phosphate synthase [Vibrio sp. LaRot3]
MEKVKLLVPVANKSTTQILQQCLLMAEQQGLAIEHIQLGISPTDGFILENDRSATRFQTDCFELLEQTAVGEDEWVMVYHSDPTSITELSALKPRTVLLGVSDVEQRLDIWRHPITGENRALSSYVSQTEVEFEKERHFCWLLALLALDFPIEDSLTLARALTNVSRETWPSEFSQFPIPVIEDQRLGIQVGWKVANKSVAFPTLSKQSLGLYPVVDDVAWIEKLLPLGINTIQLRIKDTHQADLEQQVVRAIELGRKYNAQVYINDYWQLALKHGAFGVHLGQEDIEESNLSQLSNANISLGLSTHGYYELLRIVQIQPSYIALGHIFPTTTKQMPSKPQGLVRLALYQKLIDSIPYGDVKGYPTVAIGGIDLSNAQQVWHCGVSCLAVVRAITLADNPKQVIDSFRQIMSLSEPQGESCVAG